MVVAVMKALVAEFSFGPRVQLVMVELFVAAEVVLVVERLLKPVNFGVYSN